MRWRVLGLLSLVTVVLGAAPPPELGREGLVAADHVLASEAGARILAEGGNAVDAAIAAVLASGVVQPAGSGLGGGGFAVVVSPDNAHYALDFREVAPAAATPDMFVRAADAEASRIGGLAIAVPGEAAGLAELHARFGSKSMKSLVRPAWELARRGFQVGPHLADALSRLPEELLPSFLERMFGSRAPVARYDQVRREALARTLNAFSRTGGQDLRSGKAAADIAAAAQAAGGVLTLDDLAAYTPVERAPMVGSYRGWTVITMPPPSSGGIVMLQVLAVLESHTLSSFDHNDAEYIHLLAETFKHAYADRANYMGDPDRIEIPMARLLSPERISEIGAQFDPDQTFARDFYGTPVDIGQDDGTLHVSVIDAAGWSVAITSTINTSFGSRVVAPGSGILLNNEMDDFVARPGEPNAYGLIGSAANAVAPGARPLSSMTPTVLISPDGTQRIAVGASGGPWIISSTLQTILNIIDFGMDPAEAVSVPRVHHQWVPDRIDLDEGISADTARALQERGHDVRQFPFFSSVQVAVMGPDGVEGASDPRKGGWPVGLN